MNNDCRYMKIIYVHCGEETIIRDPRSYEHYWTNSWIRPENIQACKGFEPMTSAIPVPIDDLESYGNFLPWI